MADKYIREEIMKVLSRFLNWATGSWRRNARPGNLYCLLNYTWVAQAAGVAVELQVPDYLDSGPKTIDELARLTGKSEPLLAQLMRALAGFGIFACDRRGRYRNTAISAPLVSRRGSWLRAYVFFWRRQLYASGNAMLEMLRTGRTAFAIAHGKPAYELFGSDEEQRRIFMDFMGLATDWQNPAILEFFDFRPYRHVVDVGGGQASFIAAILRANPHMKGTIFDRPHAGQAVAERLAECGLTDRCGFEGGDFFQSVPAGADLYTLKHVLPDWSDEDAVRILRNVAAAMSPDSLLLIIEGVMDERNRRDQILKMRDLEEMIYAGGRMRTRKELQAIIEGAGLVWERTVPTAVVDCSLLYCRKRG
jgi:hypothetical protein